ncbi:MAG TPA: DUF3617 domain-containing protein [Terriglobales bacterium]|nr:DUF3617 domain-containing protein [Terriglobales bacterium]
MRPQNILRAVAGILLVLASAASLFSQTQKSEGPQGVKYQPLSLKPGLWEKTTTITRTGAMPIPPEMLNRLTPEQRARMDERMKTNSAGHTGTTTDRSCITREDLEKPINFNKECTWTILESTSTKAKGTVSCEAQGMRMNGTGEFEAPDPEHLKASIHTTSTDGGHTMTIDGTFTSKWLAASCEKEQ